VMRGGVNRWRLVPRKILRKRALSEEGFWTRLASSIMRRPIPYLLASGGVMVVLAVIGLTGIHLTGGDNRGVPKTTEATKGLALLEKTLGPGALAPSQVIVDTGHAGGAYTPAAVAAQRRFIASIRGDREVDPRTIQIPAAVPRQLARRAKLLEPTGRYMQLRVAGRSDSGTDAAVDLVRRLRDRYVPEARFPGPTVYVTGAPAFGVDFVDKAYGAFPWLIVAVLVLSYLILLRAFRSVVLPLKAVVMNVLSVSATYGVLVLFFQDNWGSVFGLQHSPQIDAWIPIFLFAMLFGLSMDYEVFLLSRMREEWDKRHNNEAAVAFGLEHTGRIITAAAVIMVAAFSGFTFGSFVGLQEFGIGLSAAILLDATVVRMILVPATMKLLGDWNWYLPERVRRALRLAPPRRPAVAEGGDPG
jgi:putative drug exporter of the RND superfamily